MRASIQLTLLLAMIFTASCTQLKNSEKDALIVNKEGVFEVEGFNLKYKRKGKGEPLLVIGTADYYSRAYSKELEKFFELIFIDSRHFSKNCNPTEENINNISLETFSTDIESFRKHLELEKISLVGHSIHAQIALNYASKYPENVKRLILIGGVPFNFGEESLAFYNNENWRTLASEERKNLLSENNNKLDRIIDSVPADRIFPVRYHYRAPLYWANPKYDDSKLWDGVKTCPVTFDILAESLPSKREVEKKLLNISMPTILILGKLDFAIPYQAWEDIIGNNANIKYILMENAGHNPQTEGSTQAAFDTHLLDWFNN